MHQFECQQNSSSQLPFILSKGAIFHPTRKKVHFQSVALLVKNFANKKPKKYQLKKKITLTKLLGFIVPCHKQYTNLSHLSKITTSSLCRYSCQMWNNLGNNLITLFSDMASRQLPHAP